MLKYEKIPDNLKVIEKQLHKVLFEVDSIIKTFDNPLKVNIKPGNKKDKW